MISGQFYVIFGVMFAARWERAQSMKTNNTPSLLLDFQGSKGSFFNCFGQGWRRWGDLVGSWGLVDDSVGIFGEAWQQDGAKWTKLGAERGESKDFTTLLPFNS